jgi:AcrR family transcriptional regulator
MLGEMKGRPGRPSLTDARKAETRLVIARAAVRLFTAGGVAATSPDQIAEAAGISLRTLWRYAQTKESCVLPLLTGGIEMAGRSLRDWPPGQDGSGLLDDLEKNSGELTADVPTLLDLVRLTRTEPRLRAVWLQVHHDAEPAFATMLAARAGLPGDDLAVVVRAAVFNSALRAAVEHYAFHTEPAEADTAGLIHAIRTAMLTALPSPTPEDADLTSSPRMNPGDSRG